MAFKFPDDGLQAVWDDVISNVISTGLVHLFVNNHTPAAGDTPGSYTEASWTGYSSQTPSWGGVVVASNIAYSDAAFMTFPVTADPLGAICYGYYITDSGVTVVYCAENFASPITVVNGLPIGLNIRLRFKNP